MKRSYLIAGTLALGAALWVGSGQFLGKEAETAPRKPAAELRSEEAPAQVRIRQQRAEPRETVLVLRGRTEALRKVEARAETHGRIIEIAIHRGKAVKAGDVLVKLAPEDRPARLSEAKALLEQRRIEYAAAEKLADKGFRAETQVAASKAELQAAEAVVERAQVNLANTVVRASFDGIVDDRLVDLGDYLEQGDRVAHLVDLDPLLVIAQVSERDVGRLTAGDHGQAQLMTGEKVDGRVRHIASVADPLTRTFRVELEIANADGALRDGVTAEVLLPGPSILAHRISPALLSLNTAGEIGVKIVDDTGRARFRPVQSVEQSGDGLWIAGLPEVITLITVGQEFVTDGQAVIGVEEESLKGPLAEAPS